MAYINPETNEIYENLKAAPICYQKCDDCPMIKVAYDHGVSVFTDRGMRCQDLCETYPDEVARAFGYRIFDTSGMMRTSDGYYLNLIHEIPNCINSMYVFDVHGPKQYHKYILASGKYSEWFITNHSFEDLRHHIMPQHYECIVDTELEAVRIANAVAMESMINFAKNKIKTAMDTLSEVEKEYQKIIGTNRPHNDILNRFWDNQDAMRKE